MAIEIFSEKYPGISPRISFSHDLQVNQQPTDHQDHRHKNISNMDSDFDFALGNNNYNRFFVHQELSSADELFSNGRILPGNQIIKKKKPQENGFPNQPNTQKKRLKELLSIDFDDDQKPAASPKSFWQFKRSNSLNCESTRSKSLIRSLSLFRSNSTGSTPDSKTQKHHHNLQRQQSKKFSNQRPPLLNKCRSYNNAGGVRFSPVLNLPTPYISNVTASFFGLGSLFCNNSKNKKKKI
ncbi:hypothetical protein ACFE04_017021 [Oxalis oulophora]